MAAGDLAASQADGGASASKELPVRSKKTEDFDIVATYRHRLSSDPDLTMPVAAVEALVDLLRHTSSTTAMETLEVVRDHSERLKKGVANPIPVEAGTEIFKQYLVQSLRQQNAPVRSAAGPGSALSSFAETRQHLLTSGQMIVLRAKAARDTIAEVGSRLIKVGSVVLTAGGSRVVCALLQRAADRHTQELGSPKFKVVYVTNLRLRSESGRAIAALRERRIPVAEIDSDAAAHYLEAAKVDKVFVGAEAVLQSGGILGGMGTCQLARLAKLAGIKVVVCAETHKFVRKICLGQTDFKRIKIKQAGLDFRTADDGEAPPLEEGNLPTEEQVDVTGWEYIDGIVTEDGIKHTESAVYDMISSIYT